MDPISAILGAASLAGAIFGNKRKQIDINWLKAKFGPAAVSEEALRLFNTVINSPKGQAIMTSAAEQGQQFAHSVKSQAAQAGFGGGGGADSGASVFATSAAEGATGALQRQAAGDIYGQVLPVAQQMVGDRMQAYLGDRAAGGVQSDSARLWQNIGQAAGVVGSMYTPKQKTAATPGSAAQPSAHLDVPGSITSGPMPNAYRGLGVQAAQVPQFSVLRRFGSQRNVRPLQGSL